MTTPTTSENIPVDLLTEILVRLPVKSILRCKSVSKPWLSLISNPNFIKSHLNHIITTPGSDQSLIAKEKDDYSLSLLHLEDPDTRAPLGLPFSPGDFNFDPQFTIIGSVNGIVCVSVSVSKRRYKINNPDIYLWNPATKQSKLIPPHNLRDKIFSVAMGFGFDPVGNDYKVVRIVSYMTEKPTPRSTEVYSAKTNVWRKLEPDFTEEDRDEDGEIFINVPDDFPEEDRFDVCVNGFVCCWGYYGMMAFDLNTEVFTIGIELPTSCSDACFSNFNDSVAVIISIDEQNHTLWTLDDEACLRGGGVEASWTVVLTVDADFPDWRVCGCLNSGDFVLKTKDVDCLLYNAHKKEAREAPVSIDIGRQIIKYCESLVSITGFKQVDGNAREDI